MLKIFFKLDTVKNSHISVFLMGLVVFYSSAYANLHCKEQLEAPSQSKINKQTIPDPIIYKTLHKNNLKSSSYYPYLVNNSIHPDKILELYLSSRLNFTEVTMGQEIKDFFKDGIGFFITHAEFVVIDSFSNSSDSTTFSDDNEIQVVSYLKEYTRWKNRKAILSTPFAIGAAEGLIKPKVLGRVDFAIVDLDSKKGRLLPSEYWRLFVGNLGQAHPINHSDKTRMNIYENKFLTPNFTNKFKWSPVGNGDEFLHTYSSQVRTSDLDVYKHVNSAKFLKIILEAHNDMFSAGLYKQKIYKISIDFKKPLKWGERFKVNSWIKRRSKTSDQMGIGFKLVKDRTFETICEGEIIYSL